ncbi:unnamed protein product [Rotaria socialis]
MSDQHLSYHLQQQYSPLIIPTSNYKVIHVNKYTSLENLQLLIGLVQKCTQYTSDTESERSNGKLALIQIQAIPRRLPALVILIELEHLPPNNSCMYVKIKENFLFIFKSGIELYSWGDMDEELARLKDYEFFKWPILALLIDIQSYFPGWYD